MTDRKSGGQQELFSYRETAPMDGAGCLAERFAAKGAGSLTDIELAAVIVAHNHPSGNTTPSQEDLDVTTRLRKAGDILGIRVLLDHLIVTKEGYVSMLET